MSERSKVSNELLTIAAEDEALNPVQIASLWRIADRIDAEMMELPKDADGVPIRVGDTVYTPSGNTADVASIHFHVMCSFNGGIPTTFLPTDLTHSNHDTLERIADDIEECEREAIIDRSSLSNFAKRIRRLAKEDER